MQRGYYFEHKCDVDNTFHVKLKITKTMRHAFPLICGSTGDIVIIIGNEYSFI